MLNDNNYIRGSDGALMVQVEPGWFVSGRALATPYVAIDTAPEGNPRPEMTELETLRNSMVESPRNLSAQYIHAERERLFDSQKDAVSAIDDDDTFNTTGKRRVRSKPRCNLAKSTERVSILKKADDKLFLQMAAHAVGYQHFAIDPALALILKSRRDTWVPAVLSDTTEEVLRNRIRIERYNVERPEHEFPEHTMYVRDSRNASPTRIKTAGVLNAFWEYRELNKSPQPLQTNYLQADNDNFADRYREEGDAPLRPERDVEAEWEMRPSVDEIVDCYDMTTVKYETRMVHTSNYPRLIEPGYCLTCGKTEMKFPVSGDVEYIGQSTSTVPSLKVAAENSMDAYWKRQATEPNPYWPEAKKKTKKQIDVFVDRITKPERLNIGDVDMSRKWTVFRIGDLYFAPYRTKTFFRGEVLKYGSNGRLYPAKDAYGTPKGTAIAITKEEDKERYGKYWAPRKPRTTKKLEDNRSPEEKAKQKAKQLADRERRLPCPSLTEDMLKKFHLKLMANGKPANDDRAPYDGLPYNVESADELQYGYAFGTTYAAGHEPETADDVVERVHLLAAVNARLSSQAALVANMVVNTDRTETLAGSYLEIGAALAAGNDNMPSDRTLIRHAKAAVEDTAAEMSSIFQELAA